MKRLLLLCCFFLLVTAFSNVGCGKAVKTWPKPEQYFNNPKEIALCHAIEKQDIKAIDKLVAEGVDVNARGDDGMRFLIWAFPAEKSFKRLLEHGADPNFVCETDFKVCQYSFSKGDSLLMKSAGKYFDNFRVYWSLLMEHEADPNLGRIPPLYLACSMAYEDKDLEMIVQMVEAGADLNASGSPKERSYIVSKCAKNERYKVLLYLLECGAEYRPHTKPGGQMQRILLKDRERYNRVLEKLASGEWKPKTRSEKIAAAGFAPLKADCEKVIAWLEAHGVSFDKPILRSESQESPEPFYFKPDADEPVREE
ncbi:MAG: hypothetical protein PVH19_15450 [Planctomycetia bacterium]|jgi:hypothetical protein